MGSSGRIRAKIKRTPEGEKTSFAREKNLCGGGARGKCRRQGRGKRRTG